MDFFEQQEQARRRSNRLIVLVGLAVAGVLVTLHGLIAGLALLASDPPPPDPAALLLNPSWMLATCAVGGAVILTGALLKLRSLAGGGAVVAQSMGGREVDPLTRDAGERRLLNVVEEMALASGVRIPRTFILRDEQGLNAFAAGHDADDAAIAVTAGMLHTLNRAELQAVVGHEFSHILNGDMRLNIRLIGVLGGLMGIAVTGQAVMRLALHLLRAGTRRSRRKNDGAGIAIGLAAVGAAIWVIGSIGVFFGRLLQCAVSRQREHLADASATQFTRDPLALASALKIIGAWPQGARLAASHTSEVAHMLFAGGRARLFATHPPLLTRIRRLDPAFDGDLGPVHAEIRRRLAPPATAPGRATDETDLGLEDSLAGEGAWLRHVLHRAARPSAQPPPPPPSAPRTGPPPLPPDAPARHPTDAGAAVAGLAENTGPLDGLAADEREALRQPAAAVCCIYGAVLAPVGSAVRPRQLDAIQAAHGEAGAGYAQAAAGWAERLAPRTPARRRMIAELAVARARDLPPDERTRLADICQTLCRSDQRVDAFEFALGYLIRRRLLPEPAAARQSPLPPRLLAGEASLILAFVARTSAVSPAAAQAAWQAGTAVLADPATGRPWLPGLTFPPAPPNLTVIEAALERLIRLPPLAKRGLLTACVRAIRHDACVTEAERDLVAAIADAIHAAGWTRSERQELLP